MLLQFHSLSSTVHHAHLPFFPPLSPLTSKPSSSLIHCAVASPSPEKKTRRRRKQSQDRTLPSSSDDSTPSSSMFSISSASATEKALRFTFMEELMVRARDRDVRGVSDVIYDMIAAGLSPGPRSFHGLVVANVLNGDAEGAMHSLKRELSAGLRPLHETFIALVRLFGSKGYATRGMEILAAMEKLKFDIRQAWIVFVVSLLVVESLEFGAFKKTSHIQVSE